MTWIMVLVMVGQLGVVTTTSHSHDSLKECQEVAAAVEKYAKSQHDDVEVKARCVGPFKRRSTT